MEEEANEYIDDPIILSEMIEQLETAIVYYQIAVHNKDTEDSIAITDLLKLYVDELKGYRTDLLTDGIRGQKEAIVLVCEDLEIIEEWMSRRYEEKNFELYPVDLFYDEVVSHLGYKDAVDRSFFR